MSHYKLLFASTLLSFLQQKNLFKTKINSQIAISTLRRYSDLYLDLFIMELFIKVTTLTLSKKCNFDFNGFYAHSFLSIYI